MLKSKEKIILQKKIYIVWSYSSLTLLVVCPEEMITTVLASFFVFFFCCNVVVLQLCFVVWVASPSTEWEGEGGVYYCSEVTLHIRIYLIVMPNCCPKIERFFVLLGFCFLFLDALELSRWGTSHSICLTLLKIQNKFFVSTRTKNESFQKALSVETAKEHSPECNLDFQHKIRTCAF